ncbi:hypothetical protein JCM16814_01170 [Desulfobaculum senezii]
MSLWHWLCYVPGMKTYTRFAICSAGTTRTARVEPVVGRADYFYIYDTATGEETAVPNPHRDEQEGCGVNVARTLAEQGVEAVLAGNCGAKAARALREAGVKVSYPFTGTVDDAIAAFTALMREGV